MRNLKKVLALVVAFSMMLSVVAFADYADVAEDASYADAVELLSALDIIKGDDLGNFNPDKTITRAEFAAVVCRALGYGDVTGVNNFVDVPADHWAAGVIGYAAQLGIVNGYGDNKFGPEDNVTYDQAVKMLVVALGFENVAQRKGGYPSGYLAVASQYKITSGVKATAEAPRATVAQLVYNALSTPKMDQTSFGTYNEKWEVLDGKGGRDYATLLTDRDIYIATGVVGAKDGDKIKFKTTEASDDLEFDNNKEYTFYINGSYIEDYKNQNVTVYVEKDSRNDYQVLAVTSSADGETLAINSDDIKEYDTKNNKVTYYTSADSSNTKTIKLDKSIRIEKNEKVVFDEGNVKNLQEDVLKNLDDAEVLFVENDGDTSYDAVLVTVYTNSRVTEVNTDKDYIIVDEGRINFDFEDEDDTIVLVDDKGAEIGLEDLKKDDVVAYFFDNQRTKYDYIKIVKLSNSAITGTVKSTSKKNGKNYVTIDGTKYEVASSCDELKTEDEGTFYIGMTGKIVDFEGTSSNDDYAYILEASASDKAFGDDIWSLKLLTAKNGVVTYDLTEDASKDFSEDTKDSKGVVTKAAYMKSLNGVTAAGKYTYAKAVEAKDLGNTARLITFKTNSKGEIKSFEKADTPTGAGFETVKGTYNANAQSVARKSLEDDAVIYDLTATKVDNVYATDINYLVDDGDYEGFVLKNKDNEYVAFVVTDGAAVLSDDNGFAIVTDVDYSTVDGEDLYEVSYIQDGEEGTVTFNDNSTLVKNVTGKDSDYENLTTGDVIMFNASADGIVNSYAILAKIDANGLLAVNDSALAAFSEDNEFYYGYIDNTKKLNGKGETVDLIAGSNKPVSVSVLTSANKYTYDDDNSRNINIVNGDLFGTDNTDYKTTDDKGVTKATMMFVRAVNGTVVDAYTFDERVTVGTDGKATVNGKAVTTFYRDNDKDTTTSYNAPAVKEEVVAPVEEEVITNDKIEEVELD